MTHERTLGRILAAAAGLDAPPGTDDLRVTGVTADSRKVRPGHLFVAIRGENVDGGEFARRAAAGGAVAVVAEEEISGLEVPLIRADDARRALAELVRAWYGDPVSGLRLVGVTGSFGKTSIVMMLDAILLEAGLAAGAIGSEMVGIRCGGRVLRENPYTTPDPEPLYPAFSMLRDAGAESVLMEVTSHALAQQRVHGLQFDLGAFTNLAPLEHKDFHPTFEDYVASKLRFFDHLRPGAPLVYSADDPALERLVPRDRLTPVACGEAEAALVRYRLERVSVSGTRLTISVQRPLPRLGAPPLQPTGFPLELRLLGRPHVRNAALAATLGLVLGADVEAVRRALGSLHPPRRRMQIIDCGPFHVLDDASQHPDSLGAALEVVHQLPHRRVRIAYAIRGHRSAELNRQLASTFGVWFPRLRADHLVVTTSADRVAPQDAVEPEERLAFLEGLEDNGIPFEEIPDLDGAVRRVLDAAEPDDLVLLLGANGMIQGSEILDAWLAERGLERR